jgi:DNA repair protein RadC
VVAIGSLTAALVHAREVFKPAVLANAAAVILAHNHPSGDPEPSREDRELTERLVKAGRLLGITVLDHVIVGEERFYSFADQHLIPNGGSL